MSVGSAKYVIIDWCKQKSAGLHLLSWSQGYFYMQVGLYRHSCKSILHHCTHLTWKIFGGCSNALGDTVLTHTSATRMQCSGGCLGTTEQGNTEASMLPAFPLSLLKSHKGSLASWSLFLALPKSTFMSVWNCIWWGKEQWRISSGCIYCGPHGLPEKESMNWGPMVFSAALWPWVKDFTKHGCILTST